MKIEKCIKCTELKEENGEDSEQWEILCPDCLTKKIKQTT